VRTGTGRWLKASPTCMLVSRPRPQEIAMFEDIMMSLLLLVRACGRLAIVAPDCKFVS
jgi:hypothetical protein